MMEGLKNWLMSVVGVSVLIAAADSLLPPGGGKQVGRLTCGLVMLCVLLQPITALGEVSIGDTLSQLGRLARGEEVQLERQGAQTRKQVIEGYFASYILDKASTVGEAERAEVDCVLGAEGVYLPQRVRLWGTFTDVAQSRLTQLIQEELGVAVEEQSYYHAKEGKP